MEFTRRHLLKLLGATGGGLTAGLLGADALLDIPDHLAQRIVTGPRIETFKNSVCSLCPGGCGIRARLIDGVPVKISGNPYSPVNKGAVCPMAEAGIEALFHPQRLRTPLRRVGKRGEGNWQPIGWDEAFQMLAGRLQGLRRQGMSRQLFLISRDEGEAVVELTSRFLEAFGSPHHYLVSPVSLFTTPITAAQGADLTPIFDIGHTQFLLNFGADLLDEPLSPVYLNQLYGELRGGKQRAHIVHFGPRLSRTAAKSSEWVPVAPHGMEAVALGLAHVLLRDGTYAEAFTRKHTEGFLDHTDESGRRQAGFQSRVLTDYYPERVEELTGVSAGRLVEIAREFAQAESGLALGGAQAGSGAGGFDTLRSIHCLNALKGNLGQRGGLLFREPDSCFGPTGHPGSLSRQTERPRAALLDEVIRQLHGRQEPIDTLILCEIDPLFESAAVRQFEAILDQVPFVVGLGPFMNETLAGADLVLPTPVFLEKWEGIRGSWGLGFCYFGLQQPIVEPLYSTPHVGDILIRTAAEIGLEDALPWDHYRSFVEDSARAIFDSGRGAVLSETTQRSWVEFMQERGWVPFNYSTFEEFWDLLVEKGGWWDGEPALLTTSREFLPGSGVFSFFVPEAAVRGEDEATKQQASPGGPPAGVPLEQPLETPSLTGSGSATASKEFPLQFLTFQLLAQSGGRGTAMPLLQELGGLHSRAYWRSWIEINPATATEWGLAEDDAVEVISPVDRLQTRVRIVAGIMPGVVAMPFGAGYRFEVEKNQPAGVNPYRLLSHVTKAEGEFPALFSTQVKIRKVGGTDQV